MVTEKQIDDATMLANYYRIAGRSEENEETDEQYVMRVAGALRAKGLLIEAHELVSGQRIDYNGDPANNTPLVGVVGAVAQALTGRRYSPHDDIRQIGDDVAAGIYLTRDRKGEEALAEAFALLGPAALDLFDQR